MSFNRQILGILFEIMFCIIIIVLGYYVWDNIDQTDYNVAKYYDNTKDVDLIYESDADNGVLGSNVVVSIHNISDEFNNKNLVLKLDKNYSYTYIIINNTYYDLTDLYMSSDELYNYYLIENIDFEGYETKVYFIDMNDCNSEYEFLTEL